MLGIILPINGAVLLLRITLQVPSLLLYKIRISSFRTRSPEATSKFRRTPINSTPAPHERAECLFPAFELKRISQRARPLASHSIIHLVGISGALDNSCERLRHVIYRSPLLQAYGAARVHFCDVVVLPPCNQLKNCRQVPVDSISVAAALVLAPFAFQPLHVDL